jgi:hypothetical protein
MLFYGQSSRGSGWIKEDPITVIFKWYYRQIRQRISETSLENQQKFREFVRNVFVSKGLEPPVELPSTHHRKPNNPTGKQLSDKQHGRSDRTNQQ